MINPISFGPQTKVSCPQIAIVPSIPEKVK